MNHFKVTVQHNNDTIQVYPWGKGKLDTSFEEACKRIGMMVMSSEITTITVYRDGEVYRKVQVEQEER